MDILHQLKVIDEWLYCLLVPSHAQTSWLRIKPRHEQLALRLAMAAVVALFVAFLLVLRVDIQRYQYREYLIRNHIQRLEVR